MPWFSVLGLEFFNGHEKLLRPDKRRLREESWSIHNECALVCDAELIDSTGPLVLLATNGAEQTVSCERYIPGSKRGGAVQMTEGYGRCWW